MDGKCYAHQAHHSVRRVFMDANLVADDAAEDAEPGGVMSMAVMNCRKVTIAAVNGHAVRLPLLHASPSYLIKINCRLEWV